MRKTLKALLKYVIKTILWNICNILLFRIVYILKTYGKLFIKGLRYIWFARYLYEIKNDKVKIGLLNIPHAIKIMYKAMFFRICNTLLFQIVYISKKYGKLLVENLYFIRCLRYLYEIKNNKIQK